MNDIEILEELKEFLLSANHEPQYNINQYTSAIENLIQRLKDLEQIEKEHKEENGRLRNELEKLSKLLYLCTPEIPQCQHGKYVSYVDLVKKLEKKDKIINDMAIDLEYINKEILDEYDKLPYAESKQKVIDYFTNKVEEDTKE